MNNETINTAYQIFTKEIVNINPSLDKNNIIKAIKYIESISIENHIISIETAKLLAYLEYDQDTIITAILLQIPKNKIQEISDIFGNRISLLLEKYFLMGNIDSISNKNSAQKLHMANVRQMILGMINDPRIISIKLAERYCALGYLQNTKQDTYEASQVVMDVYAPLANRLGIGSLKWRLEDIAFKNINPEHYYAIHNEIESSSEKREAIIDKLIAEIKSEIEKSQIKKFKITGRAKHIYSIYKKMQKKNLSLHNIFDAIAIRIYVQTIDECYETLSILQSCWNTINSEYDDYIAKPKSNGYQSIHLTLLEQKQAFEVQIRTLSMHEHAEFGVAAHWMYKTEQKLHSANENSIKKLRSILEWKNIFQEKYLSKHNIDTNKIYVFSPSGDAYALSKDSTPIDFAYSIHTDIGHMCAGAKVNGKIVPLSYKLQNADQINILTNKQHKPSRDWLTYANKYVKTSKAKQRISQWFSQYDKSSLIEIGKEKLIKRIRSHPDIKESINNCLEKSIFSNLEDLYASIARGDTKISHLLENKEQNRFKRPSSAKTNNTQQALVCGLNNIKTSIAKCCNPKHGSEIVGYITHNNGINIHNAKCRNIKNKQGIQIEKIIQAKWDNSVVDKNIFYLEITTTKSISSLIKSILKLLSKERTTVTNIYSKTNIDTTTTNRFYISTDTPLHICKERIILFAGKNEESIFFMSN